MKLNLLILLLLVAAPAYAAGTSILGMVLTSIFIVVMLILYWLVVSEYGSKDKSDKDDK